MIAWPVILAHCMGIDVNEFEVVSVFDSEKDVDYGAASLWDDVWRMDDGSLDHTHPDVEAIFKNMLSLSFYTTEEKLDQDSMSEGTNEEQQSDPEYDDDTYKMVHIDVKDVPHSTDT